MSMQKNRYNTFNGVFVPTIISILGVIMYLRQGWVVGNAGLLWSWVIIIFSVVIALATGMSLSSIATNTRLHAGGAYAIISRSLGLEAGACIGVALYLAQSFASSDDARDTGKFSGYEKMVFFSGAAAT